MSKIFHIAFTCFGFIYKILSKKHRIVHLLVVRGLFNTEGIWEHGTIKQILQEYVLKMCVNPRLRVGQGQVFYVSCTDTFRVDSREDNIVTMLIFSSLCIFFNESQSISTDTYFLRNISIP
jgi:hypothetical protein